MALIPVELIVGDSYVLASSGRSGECGPLDLSSSVRRSSSNDRHDTEASRQSLHGCACGVELRELAGASGVGRSDANANETVSGQRRQGGDGGHGNSASGSTHDGSACAITVGRLWEVGSVGRQEQDLVGSDRRRVSVGSRPSDLDAGLRCVGQDHSGDAGLAWGVSGHGSEHGRERAGAVDVARADDEPVW